MTTTKTEPINSAGEGVSLDAETREKLLEKLAIELEHHIPAAFSHGWIDCTCGHSIRNYYWSRHIIGADGRANAPYLRDLLATEESPQ